MSNTSNLSEPSSINELLNGMRQLKESGGRDVRLTPTAAHDYLHVVGAFKTTLKGYRDQAADLADSSKYGNPGGFVSATQTRAQLVGAVIAANNGLVANFDGYLTYLDEVEKAVKAALTRFEAEDNS